MKTTYYFKQTEVTLFYKIPKNNRPERLCRCIDRLITIDGVVVV